MFVYEKDDALNIVFGATQIPVEKDTADVVIWQETFEEDNPEGYDPGTYTFVKIGESIFSDASSR